MYMTRALPVERRKQEAKKEAMNSMNDVFTDEVLQELFPAERANDFFEALFGDANEGAYDISLSFQGHDEQSNSLHFNLDLHERPGCCLACNLTSGLPEVFSRHKVINIQGLVSDVEKRLGGEAKCGTWKLGRTQQPAKSLHFIPLQIDLT
ncbi:MAG: pancreas/duodenum homeobox protein 1 [Candidatus Electrothrix sp. GW3-4]|uniref:pancreas/duodenum homeobox protein 1 n=1 Tax=Candidatus Electrothrix sp. GW3-4 TaxID=3126740 RepID=UPI0030D43478